MSNEEDKGQKMSGSSVNLQTFHRYDLEDIVLSCEITLDQIIQILHRIEDKSDLLKQVFNLTWDPNTEYDLVAQESDFFIFNVPPSGWGEILEDLCLDDTERQAVREAHTNKGQDLMNQANVSAKSSDYDSLFILPHHENWTLSKDVIRQRLTQLAEQGLTPAEIIDYWMVEMQKLPPQKWANSRRVHAESVRKNVRQARDKLE